MKVYGHPASTCTRKVLTALAEKGHEAEFVLVDLTKGAQKNADFLARQPFGVVPVLEDDGFQLYESRAIIRYLDQKLSGTSLTPKDLRQAALMEQWISVEQSYFTPAAMKIIMNKLFAPMMGRPVDEGAVQQGQKDLTKAIDVLDPVLQKQDFLGGSTFSLADICYMPYVAYLFPAGAGDLVTSRKGFGAWWTRVSERASWQKASGANAKPAS